MADLEEQWYKALFEEDCPCVMELLKEDPTLLKRGWNSEPERLVQGSRVNFWMPETVTKWKGRTALHVGARRGCAELIKQVIKLCYGGDHSDRVQFKADDKKGTRIAGSSRSQDDGIVVSEGHLQPAHATPQISSAALDIGRSSDGILPAQANSNSGIDGETDNQRGESLFGDFKSELAQASARGSVNFNTLLALKDGEYQLDARAMAVLNGNLDVLSLLLSQNSSVIRPQKVNHRNQLRAKIEGWTKRIEDDPVSRKRCQAIFDAYSKHRDFNFLPRGEYFFHFLFTNYFKAVRDDDSLIKAKLIREYLRLEVWGDKSSLGREPLRGYLLKLHDGQGRTPLHVAVDEGTVSAFKDLLCLIPEVDDLRAAYNCAMTAPDGLGRTAWHRAVAIGDRDALLAMENFRGIQIAPKTAWQQTMKDTARSMRMRGIVVDLDYLSYKNGFEGKRLLSWTTPLHTALLHKRREILKLAEFSPEDMRFFCAIGITSQEKIVFMLDSLELATLMGEVETVRRLLHVDTVSGKVKYGWLVGESRGEIRGESKPMYSIKAFAWPTIHLAASCGNFEVLKAFIECPNKKCDLFIEDLQQNTVLHHAMKLRNFELKPHLLDYANCEHLLSNDPRKTKDNLSNVERQGCINLLLQSGCEIFKSNKDGEIPYPGGYLSTSADFLSWWYDKQSKEFGASQNTLSLATNAVSVIATLVATASYLGPFQPPLGYTNGLDPPGPTQIQAQYIWVRIFIVCDTLSFYLAIAAITLSLIPSLPMPQQPMTQELERTRGMIILAVATLFPSIVCILMAFASSSIAVINANGISSSGGSLTIITISVGGVICLMGFLLLFIRLLGITFPGTTWVRKIYNFTSSFLQWRS